MRTCLQSRGCSHFLYAKMLTSLPQPSLGLTPLGEWQCLLLTAQPYRLPQHGGRGAVTGTWEGTEENQAD